MIQWIIGQCHISDLIRALVRTRPILYLTSNLVCFAEVTIRTTFSHMISFAGNLLKMPSTNVFNKLCVKITAKIYSERKLTGYVIWCSSHYASIYITTSYSGGIQWLPSPKAWQMLIRAPSLRATPLWEEPLTLSKTTNLRLFQTQKSLQTTISNLMKMEESSSNRWEKEKLLLPNNFSFSQCVV